MKDSSGDWNNTKAMLDAFAKSGFDVFAGSEVFLLDNMRNGGKGCITATGNINPGPIANVYKNWRSTEADKLQAGITATRKIVQKQPMIPALKSGGGALRQRPQWKTCRPPLVELDLRAGRRTDPRPQGRRLHHARARWLKTALVTGAARGIGRATRRGAAQGRLQGHRPGP